MLNRRQEMSPMAETLMRRGFCLECGMIMIVIEVKLLLRRSLNLSIYPRRSNLLPSLLPVSLFVLIIIKTHFP
jgi:hypothetical protein